VQFIFCGPVLSKSVFFDTINSKEGKKDICIDFRHHMSVEL
jgi:hypothetical protein